MLLDGLLGRLRIRHAGHSRERQALIVLRASWMRWHRCLLVDNLLRWLLRSWPASVVWEQRLGCHSESLECLAEGIGTLPHGAEWVRRLGMVRVVVLERASRLSSLRLGGREGIERVV